MNLTDTIKKIDKIDALIEKLEEKEKALQDSLLDWIYRERKQVVDYHNTSRYADHFSQREPDCYVSLSASLGPNEVIIVARENYGDHDTESLCIPLKHLLEPEIVANLIANNKARQAAQEAEAKLVQEETEKKLLANLKAKYESKLKAKYESKP